MRLQRRIDVKVIHRGPSTGSAADLTLLCTGRAAADVGTNVGGERLMRASASRARGIARGCWRLVNFCRFYYVDFFYSVLSSIDRRFAAGNRRCIAFFWFAGPGGNRWDVGGGIEDEKKPALVGRKKPWKRDYQLLH